MDDKPGTTAAGRFYCHVCRDEKPNQEIEWLRVAIRKALAPNYPFDKAG